MIRAFLPAKSGNALRRRATGLVITVLAGGFLAATMVRLSPGFDVDERELDPRLGRASQDALRNARAPERNVAAFYVRHMRGLLRGDLGYCRTLGRPLRTLLSERLPVTLRLMGFGLVSGWALGLSLGALVIMYRIPLLDGAATAAAGLLLCVPTAALAMLLFAYGGPVELALGLIVLPKVFTWAHGLFHQISVQPHVLAARARGVGELQIMWRHVLRIAAPELLALAGVSVSTAFGTAIPLEALCDLPGVGQLAWKAAMGRDLPVLITLTLLIALLTQLAGAIADLATAGLARERPAT